jgi:hypothetical protein
MGQEAIATILVIAVIILGSALLATIFFGPNWRK